MANDFGTSDPRKGDRHKHVAVRFAVQFPVGTTLTVDEFDLWCESEGLLTVPPSPVAKSSDAWLAHLQRRHQIKHGLNQALTHARMNAVGGVQPCRIVSVSTPGGRRFEVLNLTDAVSNNKMAKSVTSLTKTHRTRILYAMQAADWEMVPAIDRLRLQMIFDHIEGYGDLITSEGERLTRRIDAAIRSIEHLVQSGLLPASSGVRAALTAPIPPSEDGDDDEENGSG
jgi:hypothetical protein